MRKKTWKRVATIALAVIFAVSLITTAEIVSGVGSVPVQAQEYYVDEYTDRLFDGTWRVKKDVTINSSILVWTGSRVLLIIDDGVTLTVKGEDGNGRIPGNAAIELGSSSTLTIAGGGTLNAIGGNGGDGKPGADASESSISDYAYVGAGGDNYKYTFNGKSQGGGGAGAGIGSNGGWGGLYGGGGGGNYKVDLGVKDNTYGSEGGAGQSGDAALTGGTVIITGSVTVNAQGGKAGAGGKGGKRGKYAEKRFTWNAVAPGTSGGGGGGGGGGAADGIGCGGSGGGAGGGGASANVDGEAAAFWVADLDDLWGHGGGGGGSWDGNPGERGDEGASNGGDDTSASREYAKSGGAGGSSPARKTVTFYTYKSSPSDNPIVNCTTGSGATRSATPLGTLQEFTDKGGSLVSGGTSTYDGKPHGVTIGGSDMMSTQVTATGLKMQALDEALLTQEAGSEADDAEEKAANVLQAQETGDEKADNVLQVQETGSEADYGNEKSASVLQAQEAGGDAGDWDEEGTTTVDGVDVSYQIRYYDESGNRVGAIPVMPGQYAAVITFTSENPDYCGDWVEPFTINKIQVEKPTPAALVFECENWETGEGVLQDAFPGLDETLYTFVPDATLGDVTSYRSARAAGSYQACFRLNEPAIYEWAGESEDAVEVWIPWSIALQEFDANDPEVTYWGTAYDNNTTTVDYTGEPIWVRPWWTPAKDFGGRFPDWFTHWGNEDRPTTDRLSSAVFYMKGEEDREGLVGYHTGADGSLEKVTAEQVYAWVCGVEIDGELITVENGDKVWYKTDEEGWKIPLAVGGDSPEGAEGYVVARDYAYADKLGVKDPGVYQAYTAFDDGAGFAATGLAEATIEVRDKEISPRSITEAVVSDIPDQTYTGKAIEPKPVVKIDGVTLAEGTDYTLSYENNVNPGEARVIITGTGTYTDSVTKTFKITSAIKPKTGDNSNTALWFSLLGASVLLAVGTVVANRKYSKKN